MNTFKLFKQSITKVPTPGSIIFFQLGKTDHGHAGIVVNSDKGLIATIEGNTSNSDKASVSADRNGDGIYKKVRHLDFTVTNSLHLIGFLSPFSL